MQRDFCVGSEWLYYKIYTGVKTSDIILIEKLLPVILQLKKQNVIQKWFFIRYKDTDQHLRIRFLIEKPTHLPKAIQKIYPVLNTLLQENVVWKIQTDTYQREIERYGESTIADSEFLFWRDSEMIVEYLSIKGYFPDNQTPFLFSFSAIDSFLNSFGLSNLEKLTLMDELQSAFKIEFEADKTFKKQLDKHYRELAPAISIFLSDPENAEVLEIIENKSDQIKETVSTIKDNIQISLFSFLQSHIHMMINRQYTSKQRMYELIIYDHLHRYYKMLHYRE